MGMGFGEFNTMKRKVDDIERWGFHLEDFDFSGRIAVIATDVSDKYTKDARLFITQTIEEAHAFVCGYMSRVDFEKCNGVKEPGAEGRE